MQQYGGKYINHGTYGCAFNPPLQCNEKKPKYAKSIGKVFINNASAKQSYDEEKAIAKKIKQSIDPKNEFTVELRDDCTVKTGVKYVKTGVPTKCIFSGSEDQLIYENGGTTLNGYMSSHLGSPKHFLDLFKTALPALRGIKKLVDKQVTHTDIKPENMLIQKGKLSIIDFGLMLSYDDLFLQTHILNHTYRYYPIEMKAMAFYQKAGKLPAMNTYTNYLTTNFNGVDAKAFFNVFNIDVDFELKESLTFYMMMFSNEPVDVFKTFFKHKISSTLDLYSFGMSFAELYVEMLSQADLHSYPNSVIKKLTLVKNYLRQIINPNSFKRISINEAISQYQELLEFL